ncbi:MAG TPA: helix-turn-helix transcriptional regulator [Micromonosporaceae bacterium]
MTDKKNPLGPTGHTVRENIERLRKQSRMSYRELSEALAASGRRIPPLGLSRIEGGTRRVDADDLVALAVVFGVNPNALLLPHTATGDVEITGYGRVWAWKAWWWAEGRSPLVVPDDDDGTATVQFQTLARPKGLRSYNLSAPAGREHFDQDAQQGLAEQPWPGVPMGEGNLRREGGDRGER